MADSATSASCETTALRAEAYSRKTSIRKVTVAAVIAPEALYCFLGHELIRARCFERVLIDNRLHGTVTGRSSAVKI